MAVRWSQSAGAPGSRWAPSGPTETRRRRRRPWPAWRRQSCPRPHRLAAAATCARPPLQVATDLGLGSDLRAGQPIGQGLLDRIGQAAGGDGLGRLRLAPRLALGQRQLMGEQLIEGEPPPGRCQRGDVGRRAWANGRPQAPPARSAMPDARSRRGPAIQEVRRLRETASRTTRMVREGAGWRWPDRPLRSGGSHPTCRRR